MWRFLPRSRRVRFAIGGLVVLAAAVTGASLIMMRSNTHTLAPPAPTVSAQRIDYTLKSSLLALVQSADLICACTVLSESPPYLATPRVDGSGAGPAPASRAVQDFSVRVDRVVRGTSEPAQTITVTQASNQGSAAAAAENTPLVAGSHYLLFLRRAANGKYGLVSGPQGLLLLNAQNRLQPALADDPVTGPLRNRKLDQVLGLLRGPVTTPAAH